MDGGRYGSMVGRAGERWKGKVAGGWGGMPSGGDRALRAFGLPFLAQEFFDN